MAIALMFALTRFRRRERWRVRSAGRQVVNDFLRRRLWRLACGLLNDLDSLNGDRQKLLDKLSDQQPIHSKLLRLGRRPCRAMRL